MNQKYHFSVDGKGNIIRDESTGLSKIREEPVEADALLNAVLDVFTPGQVMRLVDEIRQLKVVGHGRLILVMSRQELRHLQVERSYNFKNLERDELNA